MKNWGIRTRVLLLALCPALVIAVLLAAYMSWRIAADSERDLQNFGLGLIRQLAAVAEFSTYSGDHETLRKIAVAALDESNVAAVALFDDQGHPIAASGALPPPLKTLPLSRDAFLLGGDEQQLLFAAPIMLRRYDMNDPFLSEPVTAAWPDPAVAIGWVTLELTRDAAQKRKREALFFTLLSSVVVAFVGGSLALLLGHQVTRPVLRLERTVARIQEGDLAARVPADSGGDLQRLEEGMNAMAQTLQDNRNLLEARIRAATHALELRKNEAERASLAKSRFLAAASHDLRQPLHALSLFAADLRHEAVTPSQQRLAGQINDSVRGVSGLLDALLDISRLDVAGVTPQPEAFALDTVFRHLESAFARSAADKSLRLRCRPTRLCVDTDAALLERLLGNLLSNAIRYTPAGSVLLAARRRGSQVCIEVRDSGIGIAPEHQGAIFEEFFQVDNMAREAGQGLGLGLSIVSRLARILGSRIEVRSAPGRGAVFSLLLPLAATPAAGAPTGAEGAEALPAARLLLLGEEEETLDGIAPLLAEWGHRYRRIGAGEALPDDASVAVAICGQVAEARLRNLQQRGTALILLDPSAAPELPGCHRLSRPLRPAKLRALLAQLLRA